MYDEIESELKKANYCRKDSDCDVLTLGGSYITFGCYHFVNKEANKDKFYERMKSYAQNCARAIDECAPAPSPTCVSNKCIYVEK